MPYKDIKKQRACQNEWIKSRRLEWVKANGPCVDCGATDNLQVTFTDIKARTTHRVWSWSDARRKEALKSCVVCCRKCSTKRRDTFYGWGEHGASRYRQGCRCKICKAARAKGSRIQRFRTKLLQRKHKLTLLRGGEMVIPTGS